MRQGPLYTNPLSRQERPAKAGVISTINHLKPNECPVGLKRFVISIVSSCAMGKPNEAPYFLV